MESLIGKCYGSLQEKLEKEKENLKNVEANIKKIIGRNVVDSGRQVRIGQKRNSNFIEPPVTNLNAELWKSAMDTSGSGRKSWGGRPLDAPSFDRAERRHRVSDDFNPRDTRSGPPAKRKSTNNFEQPKTVFSRLSGPVRDPVTDSTNHFPAFRRHTLSSQIVVTPVEVPSRSEALEVQRKDPNNKERNKRMFGALLGTLRKFKQDETKLKDREEKKALIEKKLEDQAIKEKQQLRHERESLFKERKLKYIEIRNIELKLARLKEQEEWEARQRPLGNFIRTKTSPPIFYLPKVLNSDTKKLLADTKVFITNMIEEKNKQVEKQVEDILKQGLDDHEMDEDHELEDAFNQGVPEKHVEQPQQQPEVVQESDLNNSGLDEFGRDISRRDQPTDIASVTGETSPAPKSRSPTTKSRSERQRSHSRSSNSPTPRDSERNRSRSASPTRRGHKKREKSKLSKGDVTKIKQEKEKENRKKKRLADKDKQDNRKVKDEEGQKDKQIDDKEEDVKPKIIRKKKKHNSSSDSSSSNSSSPEEATDDEDSDSYDENKVIKKENLDRLVKKEKEERLDDKESREVSTEENVPTGNVTLESAVHNGSSFPVDLNSISLPGE